MTNGFGHVSLSVAVFDVPMMLDALRLASGTALCMGEPQARKDFSAYRSALGVELPDEVLFFDGYRWAELGRALNQPGATYSVGTKKVPNRYWSQPEKRWVTVTCGDLTIVGNDHGTRAWLEGIEDFEKVARDLRVYLKRIAPMDALCIDEEGA